MKKISSLLLVAVVLIVIWFFYPSFVSEDHKTSVDKPPAASEAPATESTSISAAPEKKTDEAAPLADDDYYDEEDIKPASDIYKNAAEAIAAVQKGAIDYDDLILEQFAELGDDCSWCPEFYRSISEMMLSMDATEDEQSYFGEILAISGRVENVTKLVDAINNAPSQDVADIFAESLELTMGDEKVVKYLGGALDTDNELLEESLVAALTNHGSTLAVDTIYNHTLKSGDPDGYYSVGIGLAEVIPEEESLPLLTEIMNKKDDYSPLAVKALLNYGHDGLKTVLDSLSASSDIEMTEKLLDEDAIDHVSYEEESEEYCKKTVQSSSNSAVVQFCRNVLEDFALEEDEDWDDDEDEE